MKLEEKILILETVANEYNLTVSQLLAKVRDRETITARFHSTRILKSVYRLSCTDIAQLLGQDHTTVLHAVSKHKDLCDTDNAYLSEYERLMLIVQTILPIPNKPLFQDEMAEWLVKSSDLITQLTPDNPSSDLADVIQLHQVTLSYIIHRYNKSKKPKGAS